MNEPAKKNKTKKKTRKSWNFIYEWHKGWRKREVKSAWC
jgi:hypothetical protein